MLRAQNAFAQAKKAPEKQEVVPQVEEEKESISSIKSSTPLERLQDKIIDEINSIL